MIWLEADARTYEVLNSLRAFIRNTGDPQITSAGSFLCDNLPQNNSKAEHVHLKADIGATLLQTTKQMQASFTLLNQICGTAYMLQTVCCVLSSICMHNLIAKALCTKQWSIQAWCRIQAPLPSRTSTTSCASQV